MPSPNLPAVPTAPHDAELLANSPLNEPKPKSIDELFSMDPLDMTNADIDAIVLHLRKERGAWENKEAVAAAKKQIKGEVAKIAVNLTDLDIRV